jgi:hypothetical protein
VSRTKQQAIADAIARRIMANTKKRFSSLHADAIEEIYMSNSPSPVTTSMNVNDTPAVREPLQTDALPNVASEGQPSRNAGANGGTINSGLAVTPNSAVSPVTVKQTGYKTITGSNAGDHRTPNTGATTTDAFKNQAGPRGETTNTELEGV